MSWYRSYRPQTVSSLHITPVREAFTRILDSGVFSHAYLLCGPKGTGKTSGARILAKVLNCVKNRTVIEQFLLQKATGKSTLNPKPYPLSPLLEPCNECSSCLAINHGTSLAVTEMDAASNRGIDDIRVLREGIGLAPADGVMSVYIIDEVHMLTNEAFNALLKVLEEPPAHVVFVLATTDPQKMPATVVSRCTVVQYRKANAQELLLRLTDIAQAENVSITQELLASIATCSDGSFRDAVKLFEQIASGKQTVLEPDVTAVLGALQVSRVNNLLNALMKKSVTGVLQVFSQLESEGGDGVLFQKEVLKMAHQKLVEFSQSQDKRVTTLVQVLRAIAVPIEPGFLIPSLPFELACLEWCEEEKGERRDQAPPTSSVQPIAPEPRPQKIHPNSENVPMNPKTTEKESAKEVLLKASESVVRTPPANFDMSFITKQWSSILKAVKQKSNPIEGLLRSTHPVGVEGNTLVCEANYKFHKEQLEVERNRIVIETVIGEIAGGAVRVNFSLATKASRASVSKDSNVSGNVDDEGLLQAANDAFL